MTDSTRPRSRRSWPSIKGDADQRASRGLSRLEDITRLISEWVWETDTDGHITYASDRVSELLGLLPIQIVGKTFTEMGTFLSEAGNEVVPNWVNPFRDLMFVTRSNKGEEKFFLISSVPYYNPETWDFEGVSGTAQDITNSKIAEKKLLDALEKAEAANLAKTEFLSTISHELRTPLTSIKGSIGLLRGFMSHNLSAEGVSLLEIISRNSETLLVLINDMLDYEKSRSGMMNVDLSTQNMVDLTEYIFEINQSYAQSYAVKFYCVPQEESLWANINDHRFGQILRNLLSNAAKFSHTGSTIEVIVERVEDNVRISIKDQGLGIKEEDKDTVFDRFIQVNSSDSRQHRGTGLGLPICQSLTKAMNGTIDFVPKFTYQVHNFRAGL